MYVFLKFKASNTI